ncbi:hypothetical protein HYALB_00002235 [Hymenoscyphus albidus]|uniref:Uncharacterized protein n=1 Tax=Hymenoscyphus albidus TaxID=595503 RepID=A0A9N9LED7_9HELO|nr:hypothetical protein HYALB_00002235 [Hymenoscyphus albidus]
MISKKLLNYLLCLGLGTKGIAQILSQADANLRCPSGQIAHMLPDGSDWDPNGCKDVRDPIFIIPVTYNALATGSTTTNFQRGNTAFSFDAASLEGKCCAPGEAFSWDSVSNVGSCCNNGVSFTCSCGSAAAAAPGQQPLCPSTTSPTYTSGGKTFRVLGGTNTFGNSLPGQAGTDIKDFIDKCAQQPGCVSSTYSAGMCFPKSALTSPNQPNVQTDSVELVIPNIAPSESCPELGVKGNEKRIEGGKAYSFWCGEYQKGAQKCRGTFYGWKAGRRQCECNLVGSRGETTLLTGVDDAFVGAVPDGLTDEEAGVCPALGVDGKQTKTIGGKKYKFYCEEYARCSKSYTEAPSVEHCAEKCSKDATCKGVHYLYKGPRLGECGFKSCDTAPSTSHANLIGLGKLDKNM